MACTARDITSERYEVIGGLKSFQEVDNKVGEPCSNTYCAKFQNLAEKH